MSKAVWQSYFDEFLFELKAAGRAKRTMKDYRYHINRFFTTEGDCWPDGLRLAVRSHFADLIDSVSPATYNLRRQYLKAFFNWCVKEEILPKNPADSIPKQKDEPKIRNIDEKVIKALLNAPDQSTIAGLRDYALILLQLDTGIRPNEALSLLPEHLNLPAGQITIPMEIAKTRYSRTLAISDTTNKAIRRLLEARHPAWNEQSPVFCNQDGGKFKGWSNRLAKYSEQIGHKVRPYDLRHTFALMFLRAGGNVFVLQKILGHTSLEMTKRYVALAQSDLQKQHEAYSPVNQIVPPKHRLRKPRWE